MGGRDKQIFADGISLKRRQKIPRWSVLLIASIASSAISFAIVAGLQGHLVLQWASAQRHSTSTLTIDGTAISLAKNGPLAFRLGPGEHHLSATRPGYRNFIQNFSIAPSKTLSIVLDWVPTPAQEQSIVLEKLCPRVIYATQNLPVGPNREAVHSELTSLYFDALNPQIKSTAAKWLSIMPSPWDRNSALKQVSADDFDGAVWTTGDGRLRHAAEVTGLAIDPNSQLVFSCSADGHVLPWSLRWGTQAGKSWLHWTAVQSLAISPNGRWLATGGADGIVRTWDLKSQQLLWSDRPRGAILCLDFSSDSALLAVGSSDNRVRIWDTSSWSMQAQAAMGHRTSAVTFLESIGSLAIGDLYGNVKLWKRDTNTFVDRTGGPPIRAFCYDAANDELVGIGLNDQESRWKLSDNLPGVKVASGVVLAIDKAGQWRIVWNENNKQIKFLTTNEEPLKTFDFPADEPTTATFDGELQQLVIGTKSGKIFFLEMDGNSTVGTRKPNDDPLLSADVSPDQSRVVIGTSAGSIAVWDSFGRRLVYKKKLYNQPIKQAVFCDKNRAVVTTDDNQVVVETLGPKATTVRWTGHRPMAAGAMHDRIVFCRENIVVTRKLSETTETEYAIESPTALIVHPTKPLVIVGNRKGDISLIEYGGKPRTLANVSEAIEGLSFVDGNVFCFTTQNGSLFFADREDPTRVRQVDWTVPDWKPKSVGMLGTTPFVACGGRWAKINDDFTVTDCSPAGSSSANVILSPTSASSKYLLLNDGRGRLFIVDTDLPASD